MRDTVIIAGFFPPPVTGQGLATERLAELLSDSKDVVRVNLREGEDQLDLRFPGKFFKKISGYHDARSRLEKVLKSYPEATVIWTALSPEFTGHLRDLITIIPAFQPTNKVYGVIHWGRFSKLFVSPLTSFTAKRLLKRLEGWIFLNDDRAEKCKQWVTDDKRFIIPNTLDETVICSDQEVERKQKRTATANTLNLLFISHMIKEKGYMDVLEAVHLVHKKGASVKVVFAGQWLSVDDQLNFQQRVVHYGLQEVVTHVGPIHDRERIKALHLNADVFLLPSYMIEGQPLSIIEAMNAGSPVITSNVGGMVDMITDNVEGFLIKPQNPVAIADAVDNFMNRDTWLRQSKASRARYLRDYCPETVRQKWLTLLSS